MDDFPVPSLHPEVEERVGAPAGWTRLPTRSSGVWRVQGERGSVVLKLHRDGRGYFQERRALERWASHLVPDAPRLLAFDDEARVLVMNVLEGEDASSVMELAPARALHFAAGAWLARLHALSPGAADPMPIEQAIAARFDAALADAPPDLGAAARDELAWARAHLDAFRGQPRVACHRDFTPDNWRWDGEHLRVLDFEHARLDVWLVDLAKLAATTWREHDELAHSLLDGYGRSLHPTERICLRALIALHGLQAWIWGLRHGDAGFVALGRGVLGG